MYRDHSMYVKCYFFRLVLLRFGVTSLHSFAQL